MESIITIDIDTDNQPVIKIMYRPSPDVRDSLVERFLESFGKGWEGKADWIKKNGGLTSMSIIRPIKNAE